MSYDIRIAVKVAGAEPGNEYAVISEPEYANPTYNLGKMFRKCTGWDYKQGEFYNVSDVYPNIVQGIKNLTEHASKYAEYNAPNGWGTTESALKALKSMKEAIDAITDPNSWTGWNTFPRNLLYIAW